MRQQPTITAVTFAGAFLGLTVGLLAPPASAQTLTPGPARQRYANCTAAHVDYPHGFRKVRAADRVRGVTPPVPLRLLPVRTPLYRMNTHLDRDGDGVACERR